MYLTFYIDRIICYSTSVNVWYPFGNGYPNNCVA